MNELIHKPFFYYIIKFKKYFLFGVLSLIITDISDVAAPYILGLLLDKFLKVQNFQGTYLLFAIFISISLINALARYSWRVFFANFHQRTAYDLRLKCFEAYFDKDLTQFNSQSTGDKMSIFNKDIENFRMGIGPGLLILFDGILYLTLIPIAMWQINTEWTLKLLIFMPIIPVVMALMEKYLNALFDKQQKFLSALSSLSQESIEGMKVIKSFRMERLREFLYDQTNQNLYKTSTKVEFVHSSFSPLFDFFISMSCAGLLMLIYFNGNINEVQAGSLFAFYQYLRRMTWPLAALGFSYMMVTEARSSFRRIKKVLKNKNKKDLSFEDLKEKDSTLIKTKNLNFSYPDKSLSFENLNIDIEQTHSYLITGATKSGKSTLLKILSGLYEVEKGEILKKRNLEHVYNPQTPFLFMESVKKNLLLNFESDIILDDFHQIDFTQELNELENKEETLVGEKGTNLSGGQKQRLSLLRAIKSDKECIILDEPLSAVDEKTKLKLIETLKSLAQSKTLIIASSNPEHFTWMSDLILIKDQGKKTRDILTARMNEGLKNSYFQSLLYQTKKEKEVQ